MSPVSGKRAPYLQRTLFFLCLAGGVGLKAYAFRPDTLSLFDSARQRRIPVAIYHPADNWLRAPVAIFNHGYGMNDGDAYLAYAYLAEVLVSHGWVMVSLQHELPGDSLLPTAGNLQVLRRPFWQRGADNIHYAIGWLKQHYPHWQWRRLALLGHSNGGDMAALYPQQYPGMVHTLITLDNRRMALPRSRKLPRVYSLRSADLPADEGVLPDEREKRKYHITVVKLETVNHNDMDDDAREDQRQLITRYILQFIKAGR